MLNCTISVNGTAYDAHNDLDCWVKKYSVGAAEPILNMVEVPYRNGALDMTEAVSGGVRYKNRLITLPMRIDSDNPLETYANICNLFSGQVCKVTLDGDEYYYEGRATVGTLQTERFVWDFEFTLHAYPYRKKDRNYTFSSPSTQTCVNNGIAVVPTITTDSTITIRVNGGTQTTLTAGTYTDSQYAFRTGNNTVVTTRDANVSITYSELKL